MDQYECNVLHPGVWKIRNRPRSSLMTLNLDVYLQINAKMPNYWAIVGLIEREMKKELNG